MSIGMVECGMDKPLVSIIIPCFNSEQWIRETIYSVLAQNVENVEIIVIDDGSTDDTGNIVRKDFPSARLIRTERQGASRARDLGTRISSGEFIQYLDSDDLLAENKIAIQVGVLRKTGADVAYGDWKKLVRRADGVFVRGEIIRRKIRNPEIDLFTGDAYNPPFAYIFRRSIVEAVQGFNEHLPVIQDARFVFDCALRGARFVYCQGLMGYYRVHSKDSLSRRDAVAFVRDCLLNAEEIETWWASHKGISDERKKALLRVYGYIARASFENDKPTFEVAYKRLERLDPRYTPSNNVLLKLLSFLFGYRNAEMAALQYRRLKRCILPVPW